ncbi:hypothetical protein CPB85DRAFT_1256596 [Mucidula mucida]|nr:hypothetical protein CPB85DRAFT_1256596 [Mucidula mucida]
MTRCVQMYQVNEKQKLEFNSKLNSISGPIFETGRALETDKPFVSKRCSTRSLTYQINKAGLKASRMFLLLEDRSSSVSSAIGILAVDIIRMPPIIQPPNYGGICGRHETLSPVNQLPGFGKADPVRARWTRTLPSAHGILTRYYVYVHINGQAYT